MHNHCCGGCKGQTANKEVLFNQTRKRPNKRLINLISRHRQHQNNPQQQHHNDSTLSCVHKQTNHPQESFVCKVPVEKQKAEIIGIHHLKPIKDNRHLYNLNSNNTLGVSFRHEKSKSMSIDVGSRVNCSITTYLYPQGSIQGFKESHIVEVHPPQTGYQSPAKDLPQQKGQQWHSPFQLLSVSPPKVNQQPRITVGKLLGKGKYSHSYLCQIIPTSHLLTAKHIFTPVSQQHLKTLMSFDHPNLVSIYNYCQYPQKMIVYQEFTPSTLCEELKKRKTISLKEIRTILSQLIEAVIIMHEQGVPHGRLDLGHVGYCMGICKVRHSLTVPFQLNYVQDAHSIAAIAYQLAYGAVENQERQQIIQKTSSQPMASKQQSQLNEFILLLLSQTDNLRLSGSNTLTHPFFEGEAQ